MITTYQIDGQELRAPVWSADPEFRLVCGRNTDGLSREEIVQLERRGIAPPSSLLVVHRIGNDLKQESPDQFRSGYRLQVSIRDSHP